MQGHLRTRLRPARTAAGPRVPAAGPGRRPGHLARRRRPPCWTWTSYDAEELLEIPGGHLACWSPPHPAATATTTWSGSTRVPAPSATKSRRPSVTQRCPGCWTSTWPRPPGVRPGATRRPAASTTSQPTSYPGLDFADQRRRTRLAVRRSRTACSPAPSSAPAGPTLRRAADLLMAAVDVAESGANSRRYEVVASAISKAARCRQRRPGRGAGARTTLTHVTQSGREVPAEPRRRPSAPCCSGWRRTTPCRPAASPTSAASSPSTSTATRRRRHTSARPRRLPRRPQPAGRGQRALQSLPGAHSRSAVRPARSSWRARASAIYDEPRACAPAGQRQIRPRYGVDQGGSGRRGGRRADRRRSGFSTTAVSRCGRGWPTSRLAEAHLTADRPAQAAAHAEQALALRGIGGEWRRATGADRARPSPAGPGPDGRAEACWREALAITNSWGRPKRKRSGLC